MVIEELVPIAERVACLANEGWRCASLIDDDRYSDLPGLIVIRKTVPSSVEASLFRPMAGFVLQGSARFLTGSKSVTVKAGEMLLLSHHLPVASRVDRASETQPYIAVFVSIELETLQDLIEHFVDLRPDGGEAEACDCGAVDPAMADAIRRYLLLSKGSLEASVMVPLLRREIHFRLLTAPGGGMLRNLVMIGSHADKIGKAIGIIRTSFDRPIALARLAHAVGMSQSSLHAHFKTLTQLTPHQYQKDIRLIEARRLLSKGVASITSIAFTVGYQSASQFSRDYARKFGSPPSRHLAAVELEITAVVN